MRVCGRQGKVAGHYQGVAAWGVGRRGANSVRSKPHLGCSSLQPTNICSSSLHSGADAILLIAAVLPNADLAYFMKAAQNLGMTCLIEVSHGRVCVRARIVRAWRRGTRPDRG